MRKVIVKIMKAAKSVKDYICPPATQDLALNTKNRDATIKEYNYGPLNVDEPGDYWKDIAKYWKTTEEAAKKSNCGNCSF
jgi:cephalosporin-C deacetylase-like acetyl esterase